MPRTPGVERRGSRWTYRYYATDSFGNRVRLRGPTFATAQEALNHRNQALHNLHHGTHAPISTITFGEYVEMWLAATAPRVTPNTLTTYRAHLLPILRELGSVRLQNVTPAHLAGLIASLADQYASSTVRTTYQVLSSVFEDAVRWHLLSRNPLRDVARPRAEKRLETIWTPVELMAFCDHLEAHTPTWYPFFCLLGYTGLRVGEAHALRWPQVDLDSAQLTVLKGKSVASARTIQLGERVTAALSAFRSSRPISLDRLVFPSPRGGSWSHTHTRKIFYDNIAACNLPHIRIHDLRHTHASHLIAMGRPILEVSVRLGHSSPAVTHNIYGHLLPRVEDRSATEVERLANFWDQNGTKNPAHGIVQVHSVGYAERTRR